MPKKLVVTEISNTIWYATVNKDGTEIIGNREEVTRDAIRCVFEWFVGNMDYDKEEFILTYKNTPYELVMRKKSGEGQ